MVIKDDKIYNGLIPCQDAQGEKYLYNPVTKKFEEFGGGSGDTNNIIYYGGSGALGKSYNDIKEMLQRGTVNLIYNYDEDHTFIYVFGALQKNTFEGTTYYAAAFYNLIAGEQVLEFVSDTVDGVLSIVAG